MSGSKSESRCRKNPFAMRAETAFRTLGVLTLTGLLSYAIVFGEPESPTDPPFGPATTEASTTPATNS